MEHIHSLSLLCAVLIFFWVAWEDFRTFKIRNNVVLALIALYGIYTATKGFADWQSELAAGALLAVLGIVFWLFRLMGAGDAKLYFPVGLFLGMASLGQFVIYLMIFSILLLLILKFPTPWFVQHWRMVMRLGEIRKGKQVPYGVPISFATIVILLQRLV